MKLIVTFIALEELEEQEKNGVSITFIAPNDSGILRSLVQTLQDGNQEVPSWLDEMARDRRFSGRGYRGGNRGSRQNFGGRDFRSQSGPAQRPYSSAPARSAPFPFSPAPYQQAHSQPAPSYSNPYSNVPSYPPPQPYGQVPNYQQQRPPQPYPVPSVPYPPRDSGYGSSYAPKSSSYAPEDKKRRADSDHYSSNDREKYRKTESSYDNRRPAPAPAPAPPRLSSNQYGF